MYLDRIKNAQRVLRSEAAYKGAIDGDPGTGSVAAAWRVTDVPAAPSPAQPWTPERIVIAGAQVALKRAGFDAGPPDGFYGPQTDASYEAWRAHGRRETFIERDGESNWGRQSGIEARFGPAAAEICTRGVVTPPWRMVLAWDTRTVISEFRCHADVAESAQRAFDRIGQAHNGEQIRDLGLHLFGGCFNNRRKRGGRSLSTHAWGVAIDLDPARNRLKWGRDQARLAQPDAETFWEIWEDEGWLSLGRARNYDWMHVQAPAL